MTIQRQYSLPNCTLILEGLSDSTTANPSDARPLMSILINAECRLIGREQSLTGGREFFESFIAAVSRYAQEVLSGVPHSTGHNGQAALVKFQQLEGNLHRLVVQPAQQAIAAAPPTQIDLTTVQLFDLVEAVDQFLADTQTLPDMSLNVKPVSKREAATSEPVARRALPAAVGVSSLAVAAIAFFFMPIPEVRRPEPVPQSNSNSSTVPPGTNPTPGASPPAADLDATAAAVPEITEPKQIEGLQSKLQDQLYRTWKRDASVTKDLVYRVGVSPDGKIVGYKPQNAAALEYSGKTPLLDLLSIPATGGSVKPDSLAQFLVVFLATGELQVNPWNKATAPDRTTSAITDPAVVENLRQSLYDKLIQNWNKQKPGFEQELIYQVSVTANGAIAQYEPTDRSASDYVQETPLPTLPQSATGDREPLAQFRVVFKPTGVLEVSPYYAVK